ncbi:MAG: hypothetical protein WCG75_12875 [Armatimonadota bacterium]
MTVTIPMSREIPKELADKMRGLAPTEGGVLPSEKDLPKTLDEGVAKNPFVGYTLNGLVVNTWGKPVVNSKASKLMEEYFKALRGKTEVCEEKLRALYRDFLEQLANQDPLWKELSSLKGQPGKSMSEELRSLVYQDLVGDSRHGFATPDSAEEFMLKSKIMKVYAEMSVVGPVLNAEGSLNMVGFVF